MEKSRGWILLWFHISHNNSCDFASSLDRSRWLDVVEKSKHDLPFWKERNVTSIRDRICLQGGVSLICGGRTGGGVAGDGCDVIRI